MVILYLQDWIRSNFLVNFLRTIWLWKNEFLFISHALWTRVELSRIKKTDANTDNKNVCLYGYTPTICVNLMTIIECLVVLKTRRHVLQIDNYNCWSGGKHIKRTLQPHVLSPSYKFTTPKVVLWLTIILTLYL